MKKDARRLFTVTLVRSDPLVTTICCGLLGFTAMLGSPLPAAPGAAVSLMKKSGLIARNGLTGVSWATAGRL